MIKRLAAVTLTVAALFGTGAALAARVHLVVSPATVAPGGLVTVSAKSSPCLSADQIILISAAFRGHAYGEGAIYGHVGAHGSFSASTHIRPKLAAGRYVVSGRCGGGNLGVSAYIRVR